MRNAASSSSPKGINARIPPHAQALLAGAPENGSVDAHGIQVFYAGMVARAAGMKVSLRSRGTRSRSMP